MPLSPKQNEALHDVDDEQLFEEFPDGAPRRLVQAAFERFAAHGYSATTTRDIAYAAGMSPAGLYVHFKSKSELLLILSRAGHRAAARALDEAMAVDLTPSKRVSSAVGAFAAWHARHNRIARVVQYELGSLSPNGYTEVAALRRNMQRSLVYQIEAAVSEGEADVSDVVGLARAYMSLCIDVCRWFDPSGPLAPEDIQTLYSDIARRCLTPPRI